jgi:hypothetical protein
LLTKNGGKYKKNARRGGPQRALEGYRNLAKPGSELAAGGFAGNAVDVRAVDTEVVQFASRHAAEFRNRLTILAPIVVRAGDVHGKPLSEGFARQHLRWLPSAENEYNRLKRDKKRECIMSPMRFSHCSPLFAP